MNELQVLEALKELSNKLTLIPKEHDPIILTQYLQNLAWMKAKLSPLMVHSQTLHDNKLSEVTEKILSEYKENIKGNSAFIKSIISGKMTDYTRLLNFAERINSTINLQSDNLRTIISYHKNSN